MKAPSTVADLVGTGLRALRTRLPDEILVDAAAALSADRGATLARAGELGRYLDRTYLGYLCAPEGPDLRTFLANSLADPGSRELLLHSAVRWWQARDALWPLADEAAELVVPEGDDDPHDLRVLRWMCYCGAEAGSSGWLQVRHAPAPPRGRGS